MPRRSGMSVAYDIQEAGEASARDTSHSTRQPRADKSAYPERSSELQQLEVDPATHPPALEEHHPRRSRKY